HHLKIAQEHMEDFMRDNSGSKGEKLFSKYSARIAWILTDMITHPFLPGEVREGIKREVNSDLFTVTAIHEKVALLNPVQRDLIEQALDQILNGELEIVKA